MFTYLKLNKTLFFCILSITFITSLYFLIFNQKPLFKNESKKKDIAITQIVAHSSLDLIRKGIMDTLVAAKIDPERITFENAQGNISIATQIAQKFISLNPEIIISISTPSTQSIVGAQQDKKVPVIFAGVSDPKSAKLIDKEQKKYVTGVSDKAPLKDQVNLILSFLKDKQSALTIGILYNPGEINSINAIEEVSIILENLGIKVLKAPASTTINVTTATQSLVNKVDAIYIPNDNLIISALDSVLKITNNSKIPVFPSDPESVEKGCLATISPDQYAMGQQAGKMALSILSGTTVKKLPIENAKNINLIINQQAAHHLHLEIPHHLLSKAHKIY